MQQTDDNLRRAAILLANLDDATAERMLDQLSTEDAARLRRMMVGLEAIDATEERRIIGDFLRHRPAAPARGGAGVELEAGLAQMLATNTYPATVADADEKTPFRFLHDARGDSITPFLSGEHPQTIAVVVSHLPDDRAAAVLASLGGDLQADVIQRLIDLDEADPEVVREVERGLQSRMREQALVEHRKDNGLESVARMLDAAEPRLRRTIMKNLTRHDRDLAERLHPERFEFADLDRVDDAALGAILAAAGPEVTKLALAGADAELVDRVMRPLTPAEAKKMRRMIDRQGPMRLSDVEEAQREVARIANQLALEGTIDLHVNCH